MRLTKPTNLELNAKLICEIELDYTSRYELIPLLEGLKHIYYNCDEILELILSDLTENYGLKINIGSYDKGFYFKECYGDLKPYLDEIIIAKKGKPTKESKEREGTELFKANRMWRAGIESLISSLVRGNGLGLCPDKGFENYKKYVAGCILARNLQTLGTLLLKIKKKKAKKIA